MSTYDIAVKLAIRILSRSPGAKKQYEKYGEYTSAFAADKGDLIIVTIIRGDK